MTNTIMNTTKVPMSNTLTTTSGKYLRDALSKLSNTVTVAESDQAVTALIAHLQKYDSVKAVNVAKVLSYSSTFNESIRNSLSEVNTSDRYEAITKNFDSIRDDLKGHALLAEKPKLSWYDKLVLWLQKTTKGSIAKRFEAIRKDYYNVAKDMDKQITFENETLDGYATFRLSLKAADIEAKELLENVKAAFEEAKSLFVAKQDEIDMANQAPTSAATIAQLELERDVLKSKFDDINKDLQIAIDISENISISYNASEVVFTRIRQATDVKTQIYRKSVIFFQTNETVFTGLSTAFTAISGVREGTKTLDAMTSGMNRGLEDLASVGNTTLKEGIRTGYGTTLEANSVAKLVNAIVEYQSESVQLISEARKKTAENAAQIETIVNDGKSKFANILQKL